MFTAESIYDTDLATVEQLAVDLSALTDRLVRWTKRLSHEPPGIGNAISKLQDAQNELADAMLSIEGVRDDGPHRNAAE